ncbi:MAG TPA: hypothetical protein VM734_02890 [Kofleriaceae bacterium]|jgi:Dyp-type peroxidase family|nr:hypothetical protein [Kofleriaceae bacterium]
MAEAAVTGAGADDTVPAGARDDLQGLVVTGWSRFHHAALLFVRLGSDPGRSRAWLREVTDQVGWAREAAGEPELRATRPRGFDARVAVALTTRGLAALGVPDDVVDRFPQEAKLNMAERARILGDAVDELGRPRDWTLTVDGCDALVLLYAPGAPDRDALLREHEQLLRAHGGITVADEKSAAWAGTEPFGFVDGLSQPVVKGLGARAGQPRGPRDEIPAGEVVLGYRNAYGQLPQSPTWGDLDLGKHGSYLVFRKLEQDVTGFWRYFANLGRTLAGQGPVPADPALATEWLAARAMGRWRNGTPVVVYPDAPGPADDRASLNQFEYLAHGDADGLRCPIGAHIRRANPRDARGGGADESWQVVNRHRLLRRGRAFGEAISPEQAMAGATPREPVGLLFLSLQASIARGFEFVQQIWNGNPGFGGLHREPDPITGPGGCAFTIPADPVRLRLPDLPRFVTPRGGAYFFLPSRTALERIIAGPD